MGLSPLGKIINLHASILYITSISSMTVFLCSFRVVDYTYSAIKWNSVQSIITKDSMLSYKLFRLLVFHVPPPKELPLIELDEGVDVGVYIDIDGAGLFDRLWFGSLSVSCMSSSLSPKNILLIFWSSFLFSNNLLCQNHISWDDVLLSNWVIKLVCFCSLVHDKSTLFSIIIKILLYTVISAYVVHLTFRWLMLGLILLHISIGILNLTLFIG